MRSDIAPDIAAVVEAYAARQAFLMKQIREAFRARWSLSTSASIRALAEEVVAHGDSFVPPTEAVVASCTY